MGAECAEPARVGTVSSWSPDFKFHLGCMEIEATLLLWWVKAGRKPLLSWIILGRLEFLNSIS